MSNRQRCIDDGSDSSWLPHRRVRLRHDAVVESEFGVFFVVVVHFLAGNERAATPAQQKKAAARVPRLATTQPGAQQQGGTLPERNKYNQTT